MNFIYFPRSLNTPDKIKAQHKALVKVFHPDTGGNTDTFLAIYKEYEMLQRTNFIHPPIDEPFNTDEIKEPFKIKLFGNTYDINNKKDKQDLYVDGIINYLKFKFGR